MGDFQVATGGGFWVAIRAEIDMPRHESVHCSNNQVFPARWAERLIRIQYSRLYTQTVMRHLLDQGQTECFVPHSRTENTQSPCSIWLAGKHHDLPLLYDRLVNSYSLGRWDTELKIPNHPYCSHVVVPVGLD